MTSIPYVFYSYGIWRFNEEIPFVSHSKAFSAIQKTPIAYRKSDASEEEKDTALVGLKVSKKKGRQIISCFISKRIVERKILIYDTKEDIFNKSTERTDDYATALMVAMPELQKIAVADKTGEHDVNASSAMGRLKALFRKLENLKLAYEYAATEKDVRRAFRTWQLNSVNFSARPFNPHPSTPGDRFSALMKDNHARVTGKIEGLSSEPIENIDEGIVNEVIALGEKGYAQYGASGKTDKGYAASIQKVQPHENVNTPRKIRIYLPERVTIEDHIGEITHTIEELYG